MQFDEFGLDSMDRKYLKLIAEKFFGGPVGLETISAVLSEQKDMIEEVVEPYLLQQGFIERSNRGRLLTKNGWKHLGLKSTNEDEYPNGSS